MRLRVTSQNFDKLRYVIFFLAVVNNRFMYYRPVLYAILGLRVIFAICGYYLVFRNLKSAKAAGYTKLIILQVLYSFINIASGVINDTITFGICYTIFIWIGITNYAYSGITNTAFLKTMDKMFKLVVIATLVMTALLPGMMITYSYDGSRIIEGFFGGKNALSPNLLMGLSLNLLVYEFDKENKVWRRYLYPLICIVLLFVSGSGTGSVIAIIFLALFYTGLYKLLNVYSVMIIHTILTFSIVVYRLHERYLYPFIIYTLHRDITLTSRTQIWSMAIKCFTNNWLLGYGPGNYVIEQNLILSGWYQSVVNETHNGILDIALSLGIMGLISFLILMIFIIREYDKAENKRISQVMKLYVFVYFVIAISESEFAIGLLASWCMLFFGLAGYQKKSQIGKLNPLGYGLG